MKVFMSVDMEGITGIVYSSQVMPGKEEYNHARKLMIGDANAAIEGAFEAGAEKVIVNDSHGTMTNLFLAKLDPRAHLISGSVKPLSMMQGVEGCNAALFVGYHAKIGTLHGVLDHTYSGSTINRVRLNGVEVGEPEINAAVAGHFDVPVVFVSGGETVCQLVKESIGEWVEVAAVKLDLGRVSAECLHPQETHKIIKMGVKKALTNLAQAKPVKVDLPATVEVEFFTSQMADQAAVCPFTERVDARTIKVQGSTVLEGFRAFRTVASLGRGSLF